MGVGGRRLRSMDHLLIVLGPPYFYCFLRFSPAKPCVEKYFLIFPAPGLEICWPTAQRGPSPPDLSSKTMWGFIDPRCSIFIR